jgi:hypothetical protein
LSWPFTAYTIAVNGLYLKSGNGVTVINISNEAN